jgi:hypothetical protein
MRPGIRQLRTAACDCRFGFRSTTDPRLSRERVRIAGEDFDPAFPLEFNGLEDRAVFVADGPGTDLNCFLPLAPICVDDP